MSLASQVNALAVRVGTEIKELKNVGTSGAGALGIDPGLDAILPRSGAQALRKAVAAGTVVDCWPGESVTEGANILRTQDIYREQVITLIRQALPGVTWNHNNYALGARRLDQLADPNFKGLGTEPADLNTGFGPRGAGDRPWIVVGKSWLQHVRDLAPDVLFLPFGINLDYSTGASVDKFAVALDSVIAEVKTWPKVPTVILVTTSMTTTTNTGGQPLWRAAARVLREGAKKHNLPLIDPNRRWQMARALRDPVTRVTRRIADWDAWTVPPGTWARNGATMTPVTPTGLMEFPTIEDAVLRVGMIWANSGTELLRVYARTSGNSALVLQMFAGSVSLFRRDHAGAFTLLGDAGFPGGAQAGVTRRLEVGVEGQRVTVSVDGTTLIDVTTLYSMVEGPLQIGNTEGGYTPPTLSDVTVLRRDPYAVPGPALPESLLLGDTSGFDGNGMNHPTSFGHRAVLTPAFFGLVEALGLGTSPHATSHSTGGTDALVPADIGAATAGHGHGNATTAAPGFMAAVDKTKLDSVATGATANSTDAQLRDRATHTGTQTFSTISDGVEAAQDAAGSLFANGVHSGLTAVYDDANNRVNLTVTAAAGSGVSVKAITANTAANTGTTLTNITGLDYPLAANTTYGFEYSILFQSAAVTTGIVLGLATTNTAVLSAVAEIPSAADGTAAMFTGWITATGDKVTGTGVQAITTTYLATIYGTVRTTATTGTLTPQFHSEVSGSGVTVMAESYGRLWTVR